MTDFDDRRFSQERQLDSDYNWEIGREHPVIHGTAEMFEVYERLAWLHKCKHSNSFARFANIYWDKDAVDGLR